MNERRNVLQESLAAIQRLQSRLDAAEAARHEPIAIIGMACRYPGGAETPEALWELLRDGTDAVSEVPRERWNIDAYHDTNAQAPGKMVTRRGGFLRQVDQFDPAFFGISPREASTLDPQQRLLLEAATEALERAGIATDSLLGSATGVFVGITTSDYGQLTRGGGPQMSDVYAATGSALNAAAGRISYTFGLQGPCVSLDTACSSSLVAVHLACQSLRSGESALALAGGVNVVLSPEAMVLFSKWGMMAPDGRCKTFDAAADGFVRAEGCAVIALKRLSDALAAGDPVLAVIRGSAVNSDGRSSGLTVPSGPAQEAVLRTALTSAQLAPTDIDYVEAHGTGTPLGDPIEVEALARVMGEGRTSAQPLLIGSVKTNLGHTEAASGLAGLLKVVMSLQHGALPAHLHLNQLNPRIDWARLALAVPTALTPWPRGERARRAGVSSFGFSGTNAHVIVEEAPADALASASASSGSASASDLTTQSASSSAAGETPASAAAVQGPPQFITISGHSVGAVRALAARYAQHMEAQPQLPLRDFAFTLGAGRTHHRQRCAFVANDRAQLLQTLAAVAQGEAAAGAARAVGPVAQGQVRLGERPRIAFVFTGQGSQHVGMGRALYESEPVFREVIERAEALLAPRLDHRLTEVMFGASAGALLNQTGYAQPALFALEMALVALWRSWGVMPSAVIGHSVGEYAAACTAGVFSFEEGLALIADRGRLMQALPAGGRMAAVFCAAERLTPFIEREPQALALAAHNGPEETVLSGDGEAVERVLAALAAEGVRGQLLTVSHAFHSTHLAPMLEPFERRAAEVAFAAPQLPLISNVTGTVWAPGQAPDAAYWRAHARGTVRFAEGLRALHALGPTLLIEIGPHPTLLGLAAAAVPAATWALAPTLRRGQDDRAMALSALAQAYTRGANVKWPAVFSGSPPRRAVLPTYAFQRERHWVEETVAEAVGAAAGEPTREVGWPHGTPVRAGADGGSPPHAAAGPRNEAGHPLLGSARELAAPAGARLWERDISLARLPWLTDHRVQGEAIVPATAYIEMAIAAGREALGEGTTQVTHIENLKPLILREGERRLLQATLTPADAGAARFMVHSRALGAGDQGVGAWTAHMSADVARAAADFTAGARDAKDDTVNETATEAAGGAADGAATEAATEAITAAGARAAGLQLIQRLRGGRADVIDGTAFYQALARKGNQWGPCFQGVRQIWRHPGEALAQVCVPAPLEGEMHRYGFHPAVSDACGHALVAIEPSGAQVGEQRRAQLGADAGAPSSVPSSTPSGAFVGAGVGEVRFHRQPRARVLWAHARHKPSPEAAQGIVLGDVSVYDEDGTLVGETLDARLWYLDGQAGADTLGAPADWLYLPQWVARKRAAAGTRAVAPTGTWLVLADSAGTAEALAAQRRASGQRTVLVRPGRAFTCTDDAATVRLAEPADYQQLLQHVGPCSAVLHLWLADGAGVARGAENAQSAQNAQSAESAGHWRDALARGPQALLHLLHGLGAVAGPSPRTRPRLWLVTSGAVSCAAAGTMVGTASGAASGAVSASARDACPTPAAALLWGLGRSLSAEHGELWGGLLDLDPGATALERAQVLAQELVGTDVDDRTAWRHGQRHVARLLRRPSEATRPAAMSFGNGTLLVTGGLGGIGLAMARWATQRGARQVLLLGRRGLPARDQWDAADPGSADGQRIAAVREMEALGAEVEVGALDVADRDALARLLAARAARGAVPVRGVLHTAGVVQFEALDSQRAEGVEALVAAKVGGAWNLHHLLEGEPLDFFVMCSSSSTQLASPLLGAYAAANAGLDALAWHRRARGQAALSINWGTWGEVGMAVQAGHGTSLLTGMQAMDTVRALAAMQALLAQGDTQAAVMPVDWAALAAAYPGFAADPFFESLVGAAGAAGSTGSTGSAGTAASPPRHSARLREAPTAEQPALLRQYLQGSAGRLLGIAAERLETATPLSGMGFDSLMAVQLKNSIEAELGVIVPMIRLLQGPSVDELVPLLQEGLGAAPAPALAEPADAAEEWEEGTL